jgi:hypothetical protein
MSLKIPKGQSESVYRRRTDNTIAKRKSKKKTTKDLVTRTPLKTGGELRYSGTMENFKVKINISPSSDLVN